MGLNNITNTLNPRYKAVVSGGWSEFVFVIKDVQPRDSGVYECQISGPKHSSLNKIITLTVIGKKLFIYFIYCFNIKHSSSESMTEVVGGPDIHVDRLSTLQMTCRVTSGDKTPAFIIWQREDKVSKNVGNKKNFQYVINIDIEI